MSPYTPNPRLQRQWDVTGKIEPPRRLCRRCAGSGRLEVTPCPACGGEGYLEPIEQERAEAE